MINYSRMKKYRNFNDVKSYERRSDYIDIDNIGFRKVLFESRHGLIWSGYIHGKKCIIKMVILSSGIHCIHDKCFKGRHHISKSKGKRYFKKNYDKPFSHKKFYNLKPMSFDEFIKEAYELNHFSNLGIGPYFYGHSIVNDDVVYGFLVMDKADTSVKNILLERNLTHREKKIIHKFTDMMHYKYNLTHGDFKPSNIGVFLDSRGKIKKCITYDCKKARHGSRFRYHHFKNYIKRDNNNYKKHETKNIDER